MVYWLAHLAATQCAMARFISPPRPECTYFLLSFLFMFAGLYGNAICKWNLYIRVALWTHCQCHSLSLSYDEWHFCLGKPLFVSCCQVWQDWLQPISRIHNTAPYINFINSLEKKAKFISSTNYQFFMSGIQQDCNKSNNWNKINRKK